MDLTYDAVSNQGERIVAGDAPKLIEAHEQRYRFATQYIYPEFRVIDCACGTGYGSRLVASHARQVVGVDLSPVAIEYAKRENKAANLEFKTGSVLDLPVPDGLTDLYISFETIEHVEDPFRLLEEAYRVLKPGGTFLVSTPNRVLSGLGPGEKPKNPFHLVEWSYLEFDAILKHRFSNVVYFGQRVRCANKINPYYVRSKLRRWLGGIDLIPIPRDSKTLERLQETESWQPENFVAVAKKS